MNDLTDRIRNARFNDAAGSSHLVVGSRGANYLPGCMRTVSPGRHPTSA
jgi:hypothetical protein